MKINPKDIIEIAQFLDMGLICFYHMPTGKIESVPDPNDPYYDPEPWQETVDKIESDADNYERFEKMTSTEAFQVMEKFARTVTDEHFKNKLLNQLQKRKPFRQFKHAIDNSDYRQDWFDFRDKAYIDFVKEQIELKKLDE